MLLVSKNNSMKKCHKPLTSFKALRAKKPETKSKKNQIIKNVVEPYKKYYNAHKSDYDTNDELNGYIKKNVWSQNRWISKKLKLTALPRWLSSKNDFNKALK